MKLYIPVDFKSQYNKYFGLPYKERSANLTSSPTFNECVEKRCICKEEQVGKQLMDNLTVKVIHMDNIVSCLEYIDYYINLLWSFVTIFFIIELLKWVCVQNTRQCNIQHLQEQQTQILNKWH